MNRPNSDITYVDVLLPLRIRQLYTYAVPADWVSFLCIGQRVLVQFGKTRLYSGLVVKIHQQKPAYTHIKGIESILDEEAIVWEWQFTFWNWVASYYMCAAGEVMDAALPAALKLSSDTRLLYNEEYEGDYEGLSAELFELLTVIRTQKEATLASLAKAVQKKQVSRAVRELIARGMVCSVEQVKDRYRPKRQLCIRITPELMQNEKALEQVFQDLKNAPRQEEVLLYLLQQAHKVRYVAKADLIRALSASAIVVKSLVDKKILQEFSMEVSRLGILTDEAYQLPTLTHAQEQADINLLKALETHRVVLLQGITGSGKTILYMRHIQRVIDSGGQVLFMLPEIGLTAQLVSRMRAVFGNRVGIYHSRFGTAERVEIWDRVKKGEYKIIIGARSALFLPFQQLRCIIVDEEHDQSYKQQDPAPRYHARDAAIYLAGIIGAKVILGSATPSVETQYNARQGKYGLVTLTERFGPGELPAFRLVDIRQAARNKEMQGALSAELIEQIRHTLERRKQVILFHNRRGYSYFRHCHDCGNYYQCQHCEVSLTYHKGIHKLVCHYCGYREDVQAQCKFCGSTSLETKGLGTERLEEEIHSHFPEARIGRMDLDTTRTKDGHARLIAAFENRELDILLGTQMVTKGLDFAHVELVGIVLADALFVYPGFRASERAFHVMLQVAGRAGRTSNRGQVVVQTADPKHVLFPMLMQHDYDAFVEREIEFRQLFHYPPFARMIQIEFRHKELVIAENAAKGLADQLSKIPQINTLGPSAPPVSRIRNLYIQTILIKGEPGIISRETVKSKIVQWLDQLRSADHYKAVEIRIDVDP